MTSYERAQQLVAWRHQKLSLNLRGPKWGVFSQDSIIQGLRYFQTLPVPSRCFRLWVALKMLSPVLCSQFCSLVSNGDAIDAVAVEGV